MTLHRYLLFAYIATLSLLHALSPLPVISFGFILAAGALLLLPASPGAFGRIGFRRGDGLFAITYVLGLIPLLLNPSGFSEQNFAYATHWFVIWFFCFWWVREWILISRITFSQVSAAAAYGSAILSVAVIVEFIMANTAGQYLSDYIPYSIEEFPFANILGTSFIRPRGFSAEPGFSAIVFNCLLPLSAHHLMNSRGRLPMWVALIAPGYLLLGSAASLSCFAIAAATYVLIVNRSLVTTVGAAGAALLVAATLQFSAEARYLYHEIVGRKIEQLFDPLSSGTNSYSRSEAYQYGVRIIREHPFGIGWGEFSQTYRDASILANEIPKGSGFISVPLEIAVAGGIAAVLLYFYIILIKLHPLIRIGSRPAHLAFFSLLWVALHHMFVLEFWFPMLWFSLAFADAIRIDPRLQRPAEQRVRGATMESRSATFRTHEF